MDTEGLLQVMHGFSTLWRVSAPNTALFQGQLYLQKSLHSSTEISVCLNNWEKVCVWYKTTATLPSFPIAKSSEVDTSKLHDNSLRVIE